MIITCLDPINENIIYGGSAECCPVLRCKLSLSPGEPARNVTKIENQGSDCDFNFLTVNGLPYADPLTSSIPLTPFNEIEFTATLCPCKPIGDLFYSNIKVSYTGGNQVFNYTFKTIDPADQPLITEDEIDLFPCISTIDCESDIGQYLPYNNPTPFTYQVSVVQDCDPVDPPIVYFVNGILQAGGVLNIPPGAGQIGFGFCAPDPAPFVCRFEFNICDIWTWEVIANVDPVYCGPCGLNCNGASIETENAYLSPVDMFCINSPTYDKMAIGERKKVKYSLQYDNGFFTGNVDFWFNPWMYSIVCDYLSKFPGGTYAQPPFGYYRQITPLMIGAGPIPMFLFVNGANVPSNKNWEVFVTVNNYTLDVEFDFYTITDYDDWIKDVIFPNNPKLLQNQIFNFGPPLNNTVASVYNSYKNLCAYFWVRDTNLSGGEVFQCHFIRSLPITGRWWNRGLLNAASEFTNPSFTLERGVTTVTTLSTITKTKVTFKVQNPLPAGVIHKVVIWVFDQTNIDNSVDFIQSYDASRAEIVTNVTVSVLNKDIESPSLAPTLVGGFWQVEFYVGTGVSPFGNYRIGAVCYDQTNQVVNSFISDFYPVDITPGTDACCPLDFDSVWKDYHNSYSGVCMSPTMKERISNEILVTAPDWIDCLTEWGYTGDWRRLLVDIQLNIYTAEYNVLPGPGSVFFYYDTHLSTWNNVVPSGFINGSPDFICEKSGADIKMTWHGRVRYEDTLIPAASQVWLVPNNTQYFDRVPAGGAGATYISTYGITYDWANRIINFEYILKFDLSSLFGQPFFVNQTYQTRIKPCDFETNPLPFGQILDPLLIEGWDGSAYETITGPFCAGKYQHLQITMSESVGAGDGYVIGFLDFNPYGIASLQEGDGANPSPTGFIQLNSPFIYDIPVGASSTPWTFKINLALLGPGNYQICGLYHLEL